jgi:hypothetical protein
VARVEGSGEVNGLKGLSRWLIEVLSCVEPGVRGGAYEDTAFSGRPVCPAVLVRVSFVTGGVLSGVWDAAT